MLFESVLAHNVVHMPASDGQRVGNQGAVAAPGKRLSAHDRGFLTMSTFFKLGQPRLKGRSHHIIGKATERGVAPANVRGIFRRMAQAAKRFEVVIRKTDGMEGTGKQLAAKLGMRATWELCAHPPAVGSRMCAADRETPLSYGLSDQW